MASSNIRQISQGLLDTWNSRDSLKLSTELNEILQIRFESSDRLEMERFQVLRAVAERLRTCSYRFSPPGTNPELDLCLGLVRHLARSARRSRSWQIFRSMIFIFQCKRFQ